MRSDFHNDAENSISGGIHRARRFDAGPEVVVDTLTGLTWPRNAALSEFPMTWQEAAEFVESLNLSSFSGIHTWRLPHRDELFSLISHRMINPALPAGHPFTGVFNGYYWTATTCACLADQAWYVHLGGGRVQRGMKHGSYMVWPVSSATARGISQFDRFALKGAALEDHLTQRSWLMENFSADRPSNWNEARLAVEARNARRAAGFNDWRLPTIRELDSLTDMNRHSPAVASGFPADRLPEGLWSATTSAYEPSYAWVLYCRDGAIGVGIKPRPEFHFICARTRHS